MKAVTFAEHNVVFAKDQKEYSNLPACSQNNGLVTFCMEVTKEELRQIRKKSYVNITVLNFNRPVQPVAIMFTKPEFPIPFDIRLTAEPNEWSKEHGTATFKIYLTKESMESIKKNKRIWITTSTFGTPLQPISQTLI